MVRYSLHLKRCEFAVHIQMRPLLNVVPDAVEKSGGCSKSRPNSDPFAGGSDLVPHNSTSASAPTSAENHASNGFIGSGLRRAPYQALNRGEEKKRGKESFFV
jgi:hypothetical protein